MTRFLALSIAAALAFACAPRTVEENWGKAQSYNRSVMTIDSKPWDDVPREEGVDGKTGEQAVEAYRQSQDPKNDPQDVPSIINISR